MKKRIQVTDSNKVHMGDSYGKKEVVVDVAHEHAIVAKRFKNGSPKVMTMRVVKI